MFNVNMIHLVAAWFPNMKTNKKQQYFKSGYNALSKSCVKEKDKRKQTKKTERKHTTFIV